MAGRCSGLAVLLGMAYIVTGKPEGDTISSRAEEWK
jgi:hypothetical protein